ncbi:cation:proton antiporter [Kitasatospora sp. NPDC101235]|uniref:cation:proton antiporter n=1 Tax=Kitasatospora sp. NPDC101235 TaxID=3364101 RepID=UPI00380C2311
MHVVAIVLVLVVLATTVATFARRLRVPAPSLLVLAGIGVALIPGVPALRVPPQIIGMVVLPPLLYASAEELSLRDLRTVWRPVTILSFGLVFASAAAVGFTAVTALGRRLALPGRVQVLVQAESLFNDATSLVLFKVAVGIAVAVGASVSLPATGGEFLLLGGGGSAVGAVIAGLVWLVRRRTTDPVLETVIALVTPYAAYVLAESVYTSGVTSVVVAGVLLGRSGHRLTDAHSRLQLHAVYAVVVFLLESVVFSIVGLELPTLVRDLPAGTGWWPLQALALAAVLIAVRVLSTLPLTRAVKPSQGRGRLCWRVAGVVTWAGTRGVMPLAAALSIPLVTDDGTKLAGRPLILVLTTAVVVFTLVVQGLTLAAVVNRSGLALEPEHTAREEDDARDALNRAALDHIEHLAELEALPDTALDRVRRALTARLDRTPEAPDGTTADAAYRQLRHEVIAVQGTELHRLYDEHRISDTTRRRLQHDLDREEAALGLVGR